MHELMKKQEFAENQSKKMGQADLGSFHYKIENDKTNRINYLTGFSVLYSISKEQSQNGY